MARCTGEGWTHELDRWDSMDNSKLLTRLNRITKPDKLACFLNMAQATRNYELFGRAVTRCNELGFAPTEYVPGRYEVFPLSYFQGREGIGESRASSPLENPEGPSNDDIELPEPIIEEPEPKSIYSRKVKWRKK